MRWRGFFAQLLVFVTLLICSGAQATEAEDLAWANGLNEGQAARVFWSSADGDVSDAVLLRLMERFPTLSEILPPERQLFLAQSIQRGRGPDFCGAFLKRWPDALLWRDRSDAGLYHLALERGRVDVYEVLRRQPESAKISTHRLLLYLLDSSKVHLDAIKVVVRDFPTSLSDFPGADLNAVQVAIANNPPELEEVLRVLLQADPTLLRQRTLNKSDSMHVAIEMGYQAFRTLLLIDPKLIEDEVFSKSHLSYLESALQARQFQIADELLAIRSLPEQIASAENNRILLQFANDEEQGFSPQEKVWLEKFLERPELEETLVDASDGGIPLAKNLAIAEIFVGPTIRAFEKRNRDFGKEIPTEALAHILSSLPLSSAQKLFAAFPSLLQQHRHGLLEIFSRTTSSGLVPVVEHILETQQIDELVIQDYKNFEYILQRPVGTRMWKALQANAKYLSAALDKGFILNLARYPTPMRDGGSEKHFGLYMALPRFQSELEKVTFPPEKMQQWKGFFTLLAKEGSREDIVSDARWTAGEVMRVLEHYLIAIGSTQQQPQSSMNDLLVCLNYYTQFMEALLHAQERKIQEAMKLHPLEGSLWHVLQYQMQQRDGIKRGQVQKLILDLQIRGHFEEFNDFKVDETLHDKSVRYLQGFLPLIQEELRRRRQLDEQAKRDI